MASAREVCCQSMLHVKPLTSVGNAQRAQVNADMDGPRRHRARRGRLLLRRSESGRERERPRVSSRFRKQLQLGCLPAYQNIAQDRATRRRFLPVAGRLARSATSRLEWTRPPTALSHEHELRRARLSWLPRLQPPGMPTQIISGIRLDLRHQALGR